MEAHIYRIIARDGRAYVGSTTEKIERRFQKHLSRARRSEHPPSRLHRAMKEAAFEGFTVELLSTVPIGERLSAEAHHIRSLKTTINGLNQQIPGGRTAAERSAAKRPRFPLALPEPVA